MKEKHLKILAGVFVVSLIIYFITKPSFKGVNIDELTQSIIIGVAKNDVKTIEVYKETSEEQPVQMIFALQEDQWRIQTKFNSKAQKNRMDSLVDDLLEMTGKVRSSDPKHHELYHITDIQGLHLLLKDEANKTLANLIVGKKSEDQNSGFIRFAGKEKVYAVDKNLLSALNIYGDIDTLTQFKAGNFVDLQAVDQKKEDLELVGMVVKGKEMIIKKIEREVEVTNADSTKSTKKETEWVLVKGKNEINLEKKEVDNFFRDVAKIRATEVTDRIGNSLADLNKNSQYGFSRPDHYVVFKIPEKPQQNVLFGKEYEKDQGYFMHVQYDGLVYKVAKSTYDRIFKWFEDLPTKTAK